MVKLVKVSIALFKYNELSGESKDKVRLEHENFLCEIDEIGGDYKTEDIENIVEESLRVNEYWFFRSGKMADVVTYTGEHSKSGTTEFKFMDEVYIL